MGPGDRAAQLVFRGAQLTFELRARVFDGLLGSGNPLLVVGKAVLHALPPWIVDRTPYQRWPPRNRGAPDFHWSWLLYLHDLLVPLTEFLDPLFEPTDASDHSLLVAAAFESLPVLAHPEPDSSRADKRSYS
jgi:hypothetical protein